MTVAPESTPSVASARGASTTPRTPPGTTPSTTTMTAPSGPAPTAADAIRNFGRMVKLSHTIFALPFALAAAALGARGIRVPISHWLAIVFAMATARTAAMGFNRIVDRELDARNPRTANRELPSGAVSLREAWTLTAASTAAFLAAAAFLGPLCLALTPVALLLLFGYSLTKRFTALCHLVLGLAISAGPAGAWIAVRGDFGRVPALLMLAVATWIAGFDVLYALADREFDRGAGLHSIPARLGVPGALVTSAGLHVLTIIALAALGPVAGLGFIYWIGAAVVTGLLIWEHSIVSPGDLSRLDVAFFSLNGYVSVVFLVTTLVAIFVH